MKATDRAILSCGGDCFSLVCKIKWVKVMKFDFFGSIIHSLCSPIDGLQLDGFPSVKVHSGCDFTRKNVFRIQWTEMFFVGEGQQSASRDVNKLTAELAKAFCRTLMPHLSKLSSDNCTFLGLRVNLDRENVSY